MTHDYKNLEMLVAKIQAQLAPDAEVRHNVKLIGRATGVERQIDVLVRRKIGQYEILIVLDAKDHAVPVDVKGVEEFSGLLQDVGAHKGALVSPKGFTSTAKRRAAGLQIDLYSPVDTDPHKWQMRVTAPVIVDFRIAKLAFGIKTTTGPFMMPHDFFQRVEAFDKAGTNLGLPVAAAVSKWNDGKYPMDAGVHENLLIFDEAEVMVDNGYGKRSPAHLTVSLLVERQLYFGRLPFTKLSAFKDELSGKLIMNAFTMGLVSPDEVEKRWLRINSETEAPALPMLTVLGLEAWDLVES